MKNALKLFVIGGLVAGSLGFGWPALAATPVLSVSNQSGNNITLTITNANPYSNITLYRQQNSSLWTVVNNLGTTDGSGYFSQSMSLGSDGSNNAVNQYVMVGGLQSNTVTTYPYGGGCYGSNCGNNCYYNGSYNCGIGGLTLNPSSLTLNIGQSSTVQVTSGVNMSQYPPYVSSNSNSNVASAYVSGYQLNVTGNSTGSTTISVCLSGGVTCGQLYVTVNYGGGGSGNVWFNPANPTMYVGQNLAVSINSSAYSGSYSNTNAYYISSNSNSNVVSANVSGTALNLYANQSGNSTITVCNSGLNFCGNLFVTVTGSGSGSMTLSQTSLTLNSGQSMVVTAYNTNGNVYVSSNSNSSVATYSISGNQITVYGSNNGSTNMSVCSNNGCVNLNVTVSGTCYAGYCGGGNLNFSPSSLNMQVGQSTVVYVQNTNGNSLYLANNTNTSVVSTSISGNAITVNANNPGYAMINVCTNNSYQCGSFNVTVNSYNSGSGNISFSQNYVNLNSNQSANVTVYSNYNYNNNFYISSNSNSNVVNASISNNNIYLYASGTWGTSNIMVCQSGNSSNCGTLTVNVNGYSGGGGYGSFSLSQNNVTLNSGQSISLTMNGNGSYSISSNSNSAVANATIAGNLLNIYGSSNGSTTMVVCQNNPYSCANVYVTVGSGSVLGGSTYRNGQLINVNGTIYIVYKNTITAFSNAQAFLGLGFSFANVINTGYVNIPNSSYVVSTANGGHPWGSWIKSGGTVYFVHESGLIPIGDYNTFLNNGGSDSLVVPANSWDFQRPMLSIMTYNDSRLR